MTNNIVVLDTIAATGGDAVMSNSQLVVTGMTTLPQMWYRNIQSYRKTAYSAGTAGTWVAVFPAGAAGDSVQVTVYSTNSATGFVMRTVINYTASGTLTAANNGAAFVTAANAAFVARAAALGLTTPVVASGTTTVTLTAQTGWEQIVAVINRQPSTTYLTSVVLTVGAPSRGTAAALTAAGAVLNTGGVAFTGTTYDTYQWVWSTPIGNTVNGQETGEQLNQVTFYVNSAASTNYTNLTNRLTYIFSADATYTALTNASETLALV